MSISIKTIKESNLASDVSNITLVEIEHICQILVEDILIDLYNVTKDAYYSGKPIISDIGFDYLENHLINTYSFKPTVGSQSKLTSSIAPKFQHQYPMLSLDKIQVGKESLNDGTLKNKFNDWVNKNRINVDNLYGTPKYDGIGLNLQYVNGKLVKALTRGDGREGKDVKHLLIDVVPFTLPDYNTLIGDTKFELRGELLITKEDFEKHFKSTQQNPRNSVAGLMGKKTRVDEHSLIHFVYFDLRADANEYKIYQLFQQFKFDDLNISPAKPFIPAGEFNLGFDINEAYIHFKKFREDSKFQLDGFVISTSNEDERKRLGESKHSPNWAVAIKFEAPEAITTINDITWNMGKTGEYTPVAILEPVQLAGTLVTRASLHNYGHINKMNCSLGAEVQIEKAGDIIPQIVNIITPSQTKFDAPTHCYHCDEELIIENELHLCCQNDDCNGKMENRFRRGIEYLKIDHIGGKGSDKLFSSGKFTSVFDLLNPDKNTVDFLIDAGYANGSTVRKISHQLKNINELELETIILMMGINNLGESTAKQIAIWWDDDSIANFNGLEKKLIDRFTDGDYGEQLGDIIDTIESYGITVKNELPTQNVDGKVIKVCLTGSPKNFGHKTKKNFLNAINNNILNLSIEEVKIKDSELLVTDDYNSSTDKMKYARNNNIPICTYGDIQNYLKSI